MNYEDKIGIIADRIIFDCKSANVDLKLVIEEINRISNSEEDIVDTLKNYEELDSQESFDWIEMPTEEEIEQQRLDGLDYMSECREAINYVCYEANCPNRIKDKLFVGMVDCDSYEELSDDVDNIREDFPNHSNHSLKEDSDIPLMDNLDDISASILSDIYGGTY